jgi:hypothetical protein
MNSHPTSHVACRPSGRGLRRLLTAFAAFLTSLPLFLLAAPAAQAAAGAFSVPAGVKVTFNGGVVDACNLLRWGYQLNGGPLQQMGAKTDGTCTTLPQPDLSIGPFTAPQTLRLYLTDDTCGGITYFSDGTPVAHVIISSSNPYSVRFADGGGLCERATIPVTSFSGANWGVTVTDPSSPSEQLGSLKGQVTSLGLPAGIQNALVSKLGAAQVDTGATQCGDLTAFINQVNAQTGKTLTADQAAILTQNAQLIRTQLGC